MKLKQFAFIIIINFYTFYNYLYFYQNAFQTPTQNAGFTRRFYNGALEDHQAAAFILSILKTNAAAWLSRQLVATAQCAPLRSAIF